MNILVTGAWADAVLHIPEIEKNGHKVFFLQNEKDSLPCGYDDVEAVICNGLFLYHDIESFKNLKYIQLTSAGYDRVPMDYVKEHGIEIFNAGGVYSIPMAEFALAGVLQLYKKLGSFYDNQKNHKWEKNRCILELNGKTVCIIGCGSVGTECAKRFSAFGCKILGLDIFPMEKDFFDKIEAMEKLGDIVGQSDVAVLTLPLTEKTEHLINEKTLSLFKKNSVIVNIARGKIIETQALVKALQENLGGAVLDVFEDEPLGEDSPLWDSENVIITPHNSFVGDGNSQRLKDLIFKNLADK